MERRQTEQNLARVETSKDDGDNIKSIVGYSAVFYRDGKPGTEYRIWSDYVERLMPGCFDRALSEKHDARGLFNHDSDNLLGRVSNGTCILSVDAVGLRFEIPYDEDDPDHQRVVSKIKRGDLSGCSFAFWNTTSTWEEVQVDGETVWIRNITDLDLFDVGPVTFPAYEDTDVGLRSAVPSQSMLVSARSALDSHRQEIINKKRSTQLDVEMDWKSRKNLMGL